MSNHSIQPKDRIAGHVAAVVALTVLALLMASQPLASAVPLDAINWLAPIMDEMPHESIIYLGASQLALLLLALAVYIKHLNPYATRRPRWLVFLTAFAPLLFAGTAIAVWEIGDPVFMGIGAAVAIIPPVLLLLLEELVWKGLNKAGLWCEQRQWRRMSIHCLRFCLRIKPGRPDELYPCGLRLAEEDEWAPALRLLVQLGPVSQHDDKTLLNAMERCYRSLGRQEAALECLRRLHQLSPDNRRLSERYLDEAIRLGRDEEAMEILESGVLRETFHRLKLRQQLNLKLGRVNEAIGLIDRIAQGEGRSHTESAIELYREALDRRPHDPELKEKLGRLLLEELAEERREEGLQLLQEVLQTDPSRTDLSMQLIEHFQANSEVERALPHIQRLIEQGHEDPELYLFMAQRLRDEEFVEEQEQVLKRMIEALPDEWRGYLRLARLRYEQGRLDEATQYLAEARKRVPDDRKGALDHLEHDIARREREREIERLNQQIRHDPDDVQGRLALIDDFIDINEPEHALQHCEYLINHHPPLTPEVQERLEEGIKRSKQSFRLRDYLGDLYFQQNRYDDLLQLYREMAEQSLEPEKVLIEGCEKILVRNPTHRATRVELALARRCLKDWPGVIEALDPLVNPQAEGSVDNVEAEDAALWVEAAFHEDRLPEAADAGLKLVDQMAARCGFMVMLIEILQQLEQHEEAYQTFLRAEAENPEDDRLRRIKRRVFNNRMHYRLALLSDKHEAGTLTPAEHYEKAEIHRDLGQFDQAIVHFQNAAEQEEIAILALARMASVLIDRGMVDLARETIDPIELTREIDAAQPELKQLIYEVARGMQREGRIDLALKYYKRIFRVDAGFRDVVARLDRLS